MDENISFFQAVWRFFTFYKMRRALGWVRAANRQFTGSVDGIRDAFDLAQDATVKQYNELRDAISEVETVVEQDRMQLESLNKEEGELLAMRDGALTKFEAATDDAERARHQAAFERFDARIQEIEQAQADLDARIKANADSMSAHMAALTRLQAEVRDMPQQKARAIAEYVSAKKIVELNDRLNGLKTSIEKGPIDAVLEQNRQLTAKARISQKLAGTDVNRQDDEYAAAGKVSASKDRMQAMLAARKAEKDAKTGAPTEAPAKAADRPTIQ